MVTDHEMRMEALRLFEENERLKAIQGRLISAIEFANSEGFQWPSDPMLGIPGADVPCDCPKGGVYSDGVVCNKCGGSEWVHVIPAVVGSLPGAPK